MFKMGKINVILLKNLAVFILCSMCSISLYSQSTIKGKVIGSDGNVLSGAEVIVKSTGKGVITDMEGGFSITSKIGDILVVSYLGYIGKEVELSSLNFIDISLEKSEEVLGDVVVAALGIKRDKKSLGYSVTDIKGDELAAIKESNVMNTLSGKVAGVQISSNSTGPSGSTRVIIRGNNSLKGDNQPLYVVDGVPIDNTNLGSAGMWGGQDLGDGISQINPDDIESMSVLKGASASALYGNRAQNGVIEIITKSGKVGKLNIEFNTNNTFETPSSGFDELQSTYGSGSEGALPTTKDEALQWGRRSWGAKMEGQDMVDFEGETRPYKNNGNNYDKFHQTGITSTNTLSISGGDKKIGNIFFSTSRMDNAGMVPNSYMYRNSVNLRINSTLFDKFKLDAKINYINQKVNNRVHLSDGPANPSQSIATMPLSTDITWMKNKFERINNAGIPEHIPYNNSMYRPNPYWALNRMVDDDTKNRIMGFISLSYDFTDFLSFMVRTGQDSYYMERNTYRYYGTPTRSTGDINWNYQKVTERNHDFRVNFNENINEDIGVSAILGSNIMKRENNSTGVRGSGFNTTDLLTIANTADKSNSQSKSQKQTVSYFGSVTLDYISSIFIELTGRNDITSTLPKENNSYLYGSLSASIILSDLLDLDDMFLKIRSSYAQIGGDTDPYKLSLTYEIRDQGHVNKQGNKVPFASVSGGSIPLSTLKPTKGTSYEFGFNFRVIDNRLGIDFAYYDKLTENQILSNSIANSSGYGEMVINAGSLANIGYEVLIDFDAYRSDDFNWNTSINWSQNNNEVISLNNLPSLRLGESRSRIAYVEVVPKKIYGTILGRGYKRNDDGQIIHNDEGLPQRTEGNIELGNSTPDFIGGFSNEITYKGIRLNFLIDMKWGGEIYSYTNAMLYGAGLHKKTLEGRDKEVWNTKADGERELVSGGIVGKGVKEDGTTANTTPVSRQEYYGHIASQIAEEFIYDASYIKLKQLSLGYAIPSEWVSQFNLSSASISVVASNLWFLYKKVPNVDPESNYTSGNAQGLEHGGSPSPRSVGFSLNIKI